MAKIAVIAVHGMGLQEPGYSTELRDGVSERLGKGFEEVVWLEVFYKDILLRNEMRYWSDAQAGLRWRNLREFMLFAFADASGLEANKDRKGSAYKAAQARIAKALLQAREEVGAGRPIVIAAHSLGGQVVSNYLWDGQQHAKGKVQTESIFQDLTQYEAEIRPKKPLSHEEKRFLARPEIGAVVTFGCNIPLFAAAHGNAIPIDPPMPGFRWDNYYDAADVLGWPLAQLSAAYGVLVKDHLVSTRGSLTDLFLRSWNPLSHLAYWRGAEIHEAVAQAIRRSLEGEALLTFTEPTRSTSTEPVDP